MSLASLIDRWMKGAPVTNSWKSRVDALVRLPPHELTALCVLVQAAEIALIRANSDAATSVDLVTAGLDLREAREELHWLSPELEEVAATVDVGPLRSAENPGPPIRTLLQAALTVCEELVGRAIQGDAEALMRVAKLVRAAERRVGGARV